MLEDYIWEDTKGKCLIIKIKDEAVLNSMKCGCFWFQHPDFFRYEALKSGNKQVADKIECLLSEINKEVINMEEKTICINTPFGNGYNLNGEAKVKVSWYNPPEVMDEIRFVSFYRLNLDQNGEIMPLDDKLLEFSNKFALVNISKLKDALIAKGHQYIFNNVLYYDKDYTGKVDCFMKRDIYTHQNELRVILSSKEYSKRVTLDSYVGGIREKMGELEHIHCSNEYSDRDRINAYDESKELEKIEREYIGRIYKEIIEIECDVLSDILELDDLLRASNIKDIERLIGEEK